MIRTKLKIIDRDLGLKKLLRETLIPGKINVTVGIHEEEGQKPKLYRKSDGSFAYSEDITLLAVAIIHEFGLGAQEERSYIRATFDMYKEQTLEMTYRLARLVLDGKIDRQQALMQLGLYFEALVKQRIRENIPPPISEETAKRKGHHTALIDTEQLIKNIAYKIEQEDAT